MDIDERNAVASAARKRIGKMLTNALDNSGMSSRELAEALGLSSGSHSMVRDYLTGYRDLSVSRLLTILILLDIEPLDFFAAVNLEEISAAAAIEYAETAHTRRNKIHSRLTKQPEDEGDSFA
jgi:transcriptional regulator with XRE-family HTH domain